MIRADYRCRECGKIEEFTFDDELPVVVDHYCSDTKDMARWDRKWGPPHTGRGSSGEPPR